MKEVKKPHLCSDNVFEENCRDVLLVLFSDSCEIILLVSMTQSGKLERKNSSTAFAARPAR